MWKVQVWCMPLAPQTARQGGGVGAGLQLPAQDLCRGYGRSGRGLSRFTAPGAVQGGRWEPSASPAAGAVELGSRLCRIPAEGECGKKCWESNRRVPPEQGLNARAPGNTGAGLNSVHAAVRGWGLQFRM